MSTTLSGRLMSVRGLARHGSASADPDRHMHTPGEAGDHLARAQGCGGTPNHRQPAQSVWLTYADAAEYTGWAVSYLRNLVSAGLVPVYGKPRVRRFRRDMLDQFLTDPDAAMRRFRVERNRHGS
jgi:excisionase family DNA binding protein